MPCCNQVSRFCYDNRIRKNLTTFNFNFLNRLRKKFFFFDIYLRHVNKYIYICLKYNALHNSFIATLLSSNCILFFVHQCVIGFLVFSLRESFLSLVNFF